MRRGALGGCIQEHCLSAMSQADTDRRKHVATLELTDKPDSDEIAFLIDDTIDRKYIDVESNQDGTYDIFLSKD